MLNVKLTPRNRFLLAILWSVITILCSYTSLFLGLMILGEGQFSDLITGEMYTLMPLFMAIVFIVIFKTDKLSWDRFRFPGWKWIAFGFLYTLLVLAFTITTDFLIGGIKWNVNYNPYYGSGDTQSFATHNQIFDMISFVLIIGFFLLFQPGGFDRIVGEEAGWRGYLLPELIKLHPKLSIIISTTLVGLVWFCYHLPYFTILALQKHIITPDKITFTIIGALGVFLGANWAMSWAFLKTRSIWPALALHYSWNLISPILTGNLYDGSLGLFNTSMNNIWLVNGEGLIGGCFHFLIGLCFLLLIIKDKDTLLGSYSKQEASDKLNDELLKSKEKGLPKRIKI